MGPLIGAKPERRNGPGAHAGRLPMAPIAALAAVAAVGLLATGCGASLSAIVGTTTTEPPATSVSTTTPTTVVTALSGEVAVAFPVVTCTTGTGGALAPQGWKPSYLLAPIPTALVGRVEFYSDSVHTVLGPTGWNCVQLSASSGPSGLVVYPPGSPNPPATGPPAPGTEGIFANFDSTGQTQGIAIVCPFFTMPSWQQREANCAASRPVGEQTSMPTPDIASVMDPSGVVGSLEGSGGVQPVTGTVIFPQVLPAVTYGSSVDIAEESCSLNDPTLCATVLSDFDVREFPVPASSSGR